MQRPKDLTMASRENVMEEGKRWSPAVSDRLVSDGEGRACGS